MLHVLFGLTAVAAGVLMLLLGILGGMPRFVGPSAAVARALKTNYLGRLGMLVGGLVVILVGLQIAREPFARAAEEPLDAVKARIGQKRYADAIDEINRHLIKGRRGSASAFLLRSRANFFAGRIEEAKADARTAFDKEPGRDDVFEWLTILLVDQGAYQEALAAAGRRMERFAPGPGNEFLKAELYALTQQPDKGLADMGVKEGDVFRSNVTNPRLDRAAELLARLRETGSAGDSVTPELLAAVSGAAGDRDAPRENPLAAFVMAHHGLSRGDREAAERLFRAAAKSKGFLGEASRQELARLAKSR